MHGQGGGVGKVVCFGELLLRLGAPGRGTLLQTPSLEVHVGGAEANVAVSLASRRPAVVAMTGPRCWPAPIGCMCPG